MKQIIISLTCFSLLTISCTSGNKINNTATFADIEKAIQSSHWVFSAQRASGDIGRSRQLTTDYSVMLRGDTMVSYLPYYGRAYAGVAGVETKSVLDFTSAQVNQSTSLNKKNTTVVTIKPGDYTEVQSYTFTIFNNGRAELSVLLVNRSPISFSGNISPLKR